MFKRTTLWTLIVLVISLAGFAASALTADEILDRMEAESDRLAEGSMVATVRFDNTYRDGTTAGNLFGMLSKLDYSLIYFIEPPEVTGTIFVSHTVDDGNLSDLWLFLPLLGVPKELVSDEERGGSFAGSSMSYDDLGGGNERDDFTATLTGEAEIRIGEETHTAYVIESVAKDGVDTNTPRTILWVDTETFVMLKMEAYNDLDNLSTTMEVLALGEFEGGPTATEMLSTDVLAENSTLITIIERHQPDAEIPDEVFASENLATFDATAWGF
jgi:hypothetical protein